MMTEGAYCSVDLHELPRIVGCLPVWPDGTGQAAEKEASRARARVRVCVCVCVCVCESIVMCV